MLLKFLFFFVKNRKLSQVFKISEIENFQKSKKVEILQKYRKAEGVGLDLIFFSNSRDYKYNQQGIR